jgi:hypothetical protein
MNEELPSLDDVKAASGRRRRRETRTFELATSDEELSRLYIILSLFREMETGEAARALEYISSRYASSILRAREEDHEHD